MLMTNARYWNIGKFKYQDSFNQSFHFGSDTGTIEYLCHPRKLHRKRKATHIWSSLLLVTYTQSSRIAGNSQEIAENSPLYIETLQIHMPTISDVTISHENGIAILPFKRLLKNLRSPPARRAWLTFNADDFG